MFIPHTCIRVDSSSLIYNHYTFITGIHFRLLSTMLEEVFWELPFDFEGLETCQVPNSNIAHRVCETQH